MRVMPPTSTNSLMSRSVGLRVFQTRLDRRNRALNQIIRELIELCPSQFLLDVLSGPARIGGNKRQVNFVFLNARATRSSLFQLLP